MSTAQYIRAGVTGLSLFAACVSADIVSSTGGQVLPVEPPPADITDGASARDDTAILFVETDETPLTGGVLLDITQPGTVAPTGGDQYASGSLSPAVVPAGTVVASHYIHTDALVEGTAFAGSVTFSCEIAGLIVRRASMLGSDDELARPGVAYDSVRQIGVPDSVTLSADLRTVSFSFQTFDGTDQIRIVTLGTQPCSSADLAPPFGLLDLADVNAFAAGFIAMNPIADLNADGLFDLADINLFVTAFLGGCS